MNVSFAVRTIMTGLRLKRALATALLFGALGTLPAYAQVTATDLLVRIDQLENQVRQLTGAVEQLQFRNQQLETSVRRTQEENEFRFKELGGKGGQGASGARSSGSPPPGPVAQQPAPQPQQQPYAPPPSSQGYLPPPSEPAPLQPAPAAAQSVRPPL